MAAEASLSLRVQLLSGGASASALLEASPGLSALIDDLGERSAAAQDLHTPITSAARLAEAEGDCLYLAWPETQGPEAVALLRTGEKHLYLYRERGEMVEVDPRCVLDFYVREEEQRKGVGRWIFERMMQEEGGRSPREFAYDRPSPKLLAFLRKHYGLVEYVEQPNRYVVYNDYFDAAGEEKG